MRNRDLLSLRDRLLRSGVVPDIAERAVQELGEHYDDLVADLEAGGASSEQARRRAAAAIGRLDHVAHAMESRAELKTWAYRYPYIALVLYPLGCAAALPAAPLIASAAHAPHIARWGASLLGAGLLTGALLLLLQLSILFG